jgi:hypothetical protein
MAFAGKQFFDLAAKLHQGHGEDEAVIRTVVSRAYYGAMLAARDKAKISSTSAAIHQKVIDHYKASPATQAIGNRLDTMRLMRNDADYQVTQAVAAREARKALEMAREVLKAI